jgi:hypothetical protein
MTDATRRLSVRLSVDGAQQVRGEMTQLGEQGDRAFQRIVAGAQGASRALSLLGPVLSALSVGALANFARRAVDTVGGLGELADQVGVSTDALQAFRFAAVEVGLRTEELDRALAILTRRIGEAAAGEAVGEQAFRRLGVAFLDAAGNARATEGVLADIADRIAAVESPAERARMAAAAFGEDLGRRMIPFLAQGREGLERLTAEALRFGQIADARRSGARARPPDQRHRRARPPRSSDRMSSPNLAISHVAAAQAQKEVTINSAVDLLDRAVTEVLTIDFGPGDVTLTATQYRQHRVFRAAGPAVARTLTLPQIRREVAIDNAAGTATLTVARGTGSVVVPAGAALTVYTDGTVNGIRPIGGVGGGDPGGVFGRVMLPFHGALAVKTATQAIAATTDTLISYDATAYDTRGFWSAGAPTRLTVPAGITRVIVSASTRITGGAGNYQTRFIRNGAEVNGITCQSMASGFTSGHINMSSAVLSVSAGDWFEILAFSSVARTIDSGARTWMAIAVVETADAAEPPADWPFRREGTPGASEVLLRAVLARRTRLAVDFALSRGHAGIAATAQTDFDVQRNGLSIGTVRFPAGSATATWGC